MHIDILFTYENCSCCVAIVKINISLKFMCLTSVICYILLTCLVSLIYLEISLEEMIVMVICFTARHSFYLCFQFFFLCFNCL